MSEIVFQERNGRVPVTRSPRSERPYSRRMPVLQKDSSMKTSRSAFTTVRNEQKLRRRARFSGVSRSTAMNDFFFARTRAWQARAERPSGLSSSSTSPSTSPSTQRLSHLASPRRSIEAALRSSRGSATRFRLRAGAAQPHSSLDGVEECGSRSRSRRRASMRSRRKRTAQRERE